MPQFLKNLICSVLAAFAMYSRVPVPKFPWSREALRLQLCCLPLVGAVEGLLWYGILRLCIFLGCSPWLCASLLTALPILYTGGIHMDGFLDTSDALHSYQDQETRLRILKDPHIGAFAVISGAVYLVLQLGCYGEIAGWAADGSPDTARMVCLGFVCSRAWSGLAAVSLRKARPDGMLRASAEAGDLRSRQILLALVFFTSLLLAGYGVRRRTACGLAAAITAGGIYFHYRRTALSLFGGVTGDLAGWFLQRCELGMALAVVLCRLLEMKYFPFL